MKFSDQARFWMHLPIGFLFGLALIFIPTLGVVACLLWIVYELNEDRYLKDQAWKDVGGFLFGLGMVAALFMLFSILGLLAG